MKNAHTIFALTALVVCFGASLSAQALFRAVNPEMKSFTANSDEKPRAWREHDLVMVRIDYSVNASRKDAFESERSLEVEANIDSYLRLGNTKNGLPRLSTEAGNPIGLSGDSTLTSDADASRRRTSTLETVIMAEVTQVMPGYDPVKNKGRLKIRAFKQVRLGDDVERVELTGDIEASHIEADDSISYDRIFGSDLRTYGDGDVSDGARPGWFSRFFSSIWPF